MLRCAFSTGFVFIYDAKDHVNNEMFVKSAHQTLKEEILRSGYLSAAEWMEFVELKARKYMKTNKVKKMISCRHHKTPVSIEHIYAIILYCDFSALCTAFSATFRRHNVFETMESVKKRHSQFAVFGRLLVQLVWEFGMKGKGGGKGPFFCGLNCILNVGSFAITLKGPCSTSTQREVAVNFAKSNGIILALDNDTLGASFEKSFDCSWISNYFEEAERLWIAGREHHPLRIASIVIVRSAKNYRQMLRALFFFDAMISGVYLSGCKIEPTAADYALIEKLIDSELNGGVDAVTEFDEYLKKEWALFLQSKREIKLEWNCVKYFGELSKLIATDLRKYEKNEAAKGNYKVFKAEWMSIFPALHTVTIPTRNAGHGEAYKFRLEALLDSMKALPSSFGAVILVKDLGEWGNWRAREALTGDAKSLFDGAGWSAVYEHENHVGEAQLVLRLKDD